MRAGRGHGMGLVQTMVVRAVCGWKGELKGAWPTPQPKVLIEPRQGNLQVGPSPSQPTQILQTQERVERPGKKEVESIQWKG